MNISLTGKRYSARVLGRDVILFNQHSSEWDFVYNHPVDPFDTLKTAGCGIFSICHAVEWMTGKIIDPIELARFSMLNGARMYDGTNRPKLLMAMQRSGLAERYGFSYRGTGPQNGEDELFGHISQGGAALCNLRVGHIVAVVAARNMNSGRELLIIDSHPTTRSNAQYEAIKQAEGDAFIVYETINGSGAVTGVSAQASAFWVSASAPFNYDLMHPISAI
ncbi:MAG: hypothetical protein Q4D04_02935 [Clostridia bacterium]|nr:hypothetical protein [Clostridia bacterium]